MCIDESQLYFDFDDCSDGESVCQEYLNFCAVQAIKNADSILDRFENLELLNVLEQENKIQKLDGHSSFVFRAVDSVTDRKVVLKCLDPLFSQRIAGIPDIDTDIDYEKLFEWEDKILSELKSNRHTPAVINRLSRVPVLIETGGNLDGGILDIFLSNVTANCYLCATFGLYQARIKNNAEKCAHYYNKATELVTAADFECRSNLAEELRLKRDLELFRLYEKFGSPREAERIKARIIKKCPEELWFYREAVRGEGEE